MTQEFDFSLFIKELTNEINPILQTLLSIILMLVPIAILAFAGFKLFTLALPFYKTSSAEEWMLVIRDGK